MIRAGVALAHVIGRALAHATASALGMRCGEVAPLKDAGRFYAVCSEPIRCDRHLGHPGSHRCSTWMPRRLRALHPDLEPGIIWWGGVDGYGARGVDNPVETSGR